MLIERDGKILISRQVLSYTSYLNSDTKAVKWDTFSYANASQEAKRVAVASEKETNQKEIKLKADKRIDSAWSTQKARKEIRHRRQEKKKLKKTWLKSQNSGSTSASNIKVIGKRAWDETGNEREQDSDDWAEIVREEKMAKRLRKGNISQKEFDTEFGSLDR